MGNLFKSLEGYKTKIGAALIMAAPIIASFRPDIGALALVAGKVLTGVGLADTVARSMYAPKTGN